MRRRVRSPRRVSQPHPRMPGWVRYVPGLAIVALMLAVSLKDVVYFNNGAGGEGWRIGKPAVTVWTANPGRSLPELRTFAVHLINRDRQLNGLPPLTQDSALNQVAQAHAEDMMQRNYYDHITPEGKTPTDRLAAIGGQGGVGENIMLQSPGSIQLRVLNFGLIETFQTGWMYSDGHRANLLDPRYTRVGYGIVRHPTSGKIYAVQNFQ